MAAIGNWIRQLSERITSAGRKGVAAVAILIVLIIAGGFWLARSTGAPRLESVVEYPLDTADLAAARAILDDREISHEVRGGRLYVPANATRQVRALLADEGLLAAETAGSFEQLTARSDLWQTQAQSTKRWQATKMRVLSDLIKGFDSVRTATVLFEPGRPRTLKGPGVAPTAAVNVSLKAGQEMTPELVSAIANLIAGSIAAMSAEEVRIVDGRGRSYRLGQAFATAGNRDDLLPPRKAEEYYAQKIRQTLDYVGHVTVGVIVEETGPGKRIIRAVVAVPRSYLTRLTTNGATAAAEHEQLEKIRINLTQLIGRDHLAQLKVDWYDDASPGFGPAALHVPSQESAARKGDWSGDRLALAGGLWMGGLFCAAAVIVRRRRRAVRSARRSEAPVDVKAEAATDTQPAEQYPDLQAEPFGFLKNLDIDQLVHLVRRERPGTIALILSHVEPAKAAAVLTALPAVIRVEAIKRLAAGNPVSRDVLAEVHRELSARVEAIREQGGVNSGGIERIAEILQHAGYHVERNVLDGLNRSEPALAESIRTRMFAFEDIANLPIRRLRQPLEAMDSDELAVALRTAGKSVRKRVFAALSSGKAKRVRQETERIGPVRLSRVEAAQQNIVDAIRLRHAGRYVSDQPQPAAERLT